jgi:DNA repair exonuclease SbcCD nuclease subunit
VNSGPVKIVLTGDTHLGHDLPLKSKFPDRHRGEDFFQNFQRVLDHAVNTKADMVIHGGDLFYRTLLPEPIVDRVYAMLLDFAQLGIPMIIVPGNHESSRLPNSLFLQHPNLYIFKKAQTFTFDIKGIRLNISGFPCIRKTVSETFPRVFDPIRRPFTQSDINILCMHQAIEGARVNNYTFRGGDQTIALNQLNDAYDLLFSGHIHPAQIVKTLIYRKNKEILVYYPGSVERTSFAEKEEEKGFMEFIIRKENGVIWEHRFITLPSREMIDIQFPDKEMDEKEIKDFLIPRVKSKSMIRLDCPNNTTKGKLKSSFLRQILPANIMIQFKGGFRSD